MWLGDEDTMQGLGAGQGIDGPLYQWVQGVDGLGNAVGCWRRVNRRAPDTRHSAPLLGEMVEGTDGQTYQWVQGVDGLGSPFGFWRRLARRVRAAARRALPIAQQFAPFVPGGAAALTAATPFLRRVGVAGPDGLGELYEAADGSMYQVQGIDAGDDLDGLADDDDLRGLSEDELQGLAADDELNGLDADDELNGLGAEEELSGFGADQELNGLAADDELNGVGADADVSGLSEEELQGIGEDDPAMHGYMRDGAVSGVEGFHPDAPRQTQAFSPSPNAPMWAPLW